jgi:hypothetical protein
MSKLIPQRVIITDLTCLLIPQSFPAGEYPVDGLEGNSG